MHTHRAYTILNAIVRETASSPKAFAPPSMVLIYVVFFGVRATIFTAVLPA